MLGKILVRFDKLYSYISCNILLRMSAGGSSKNGDDCRVAVDEKMRAELEYQYSPSRWSRRADAESVIESHVALCTSVSLKAKATIPYEVLRYGEGKNQLIDLFGTTLPKDSPLFVYVHGGYWQDLQRSISAYVVEPLFKKGIRVAVVGYDLAPSVTLDEIIQEINTLDGFISNWAKTNKSKNVWYAGHSAGAYLITCILKKRAEDKSCTNAYPIRGMFFISGIYDLEPLVDTYVNDELKLSRCEAKNRSLRELPLKDLPFMTLMVVVAENDSDEFRRQSREFYNMLSKGSQNVLFMEIAEKDHFDVVEKLNDENYELTQKIIELIGN